MSRTVIVNADDLGMCPAVNAGVFEAFDHGIVRSTSLMALAPAADDAALDLPQRVAAGLGVGLHLDLGEWAFEGGEWRQVRHVVDGDDPDAIEQAVGEQLERFRELVGAEPTHIDSHQHAHRSEPARSVISAVAATLRIPVRALESQVAYCGDFYGQDRDGQPLDVSAAALIRILRELDAPVTELSCHPALGRPADRLYAAPRARELAALCDRAVLRAIQRAEIRLASFRDLAGKSA